MSRGMLLMRCCVFSTQCTFVLSFARARLKRNVFLTPRSGTWARHLLGSAQEPQPYTPKKTHLFCVYALGVLCVGFCFAVFCYSLLGWLLLGGRPLRSVTFAPR